MFKMKCSSVLLAAVLALGTTSCYTLEHTVGRGAQGSQKEEKRVWFVLWGLVPLGDFDSQKLAGDSKDYTVKSQQSVLDVIMNIFTGYISFVSRTVTVTK